MPAPHKPSATEIFEGAKPAVMLVQVNLDISTSFPQIVPNQARVDALVARIQALIRQGKIRSQAAADAYYQDQLLADPGTYFAAGSARTTQHVRSTSWGSGFLATPDGYLVTAAHVVAPDAQDLLQEVVDSARQDDLQAVTDSLRKAFGVQAQGLTAAQALAFSQWELGFYKANVTVDTYSKEIFVGTGPTVYFNGRAPSFALPAKEVVSGTTEPGKDVSIVKVDGSGFPALALGSEATLSSRSSLYELGYPCLACDPVAAPDSIDLAVSRGTPTGLRFEDGWKAIGTNAATDHGGSGGPVLDETGRVIGIVSFLESGGTFLVPSSVIRELTDKAGVKPAAGPTTSLYREGLADYYQHRYRAALPLFRRVLQLDHGHEYVSPFIATADIALSHGKDQTPPDLSAFVLPVTGLLLFLFLGAVAVPTLAYGGRRQRAQ